MVCVREIVGGEPDYGTPGFVIVERVLKEREEGGEVDEMG